MQQVALTERENFMQLIRGKQPEWVPYYPDAVDWIVPCFMMQHMATEEKRDFCGVPWTIEESGLMVNTRLEPVLDDIANWREVVHLPDLDKLDWEKIAAFDLAKHDPGKVAECWASQGSGGNFFLPIVDMMGFEDGLCSFIEDPESVAELCTHLCDFYMKLVDYEEKYYKPDMYALADDICTENGPFISEGVYEELLRPHYKRLIEHIKSYGKPIEFHMCGKGEHFIEDMHDLGITVWQPAQPINDLAGLKKKYGNRLIFVGGWSANSGAGLPGTPEDEVRQSVRDSIDALASGGGYTFWAGSPMGRSPEVLEKMGWIADEARQYGRRFYS